jgi:hypothetical protein
MNRRSLIYAGIAILFTACSNQGNEELTSQVPLSIDATLTETTTRGEIVTNFDADSQLGVYMGDYKNRLFTTSDGTTFNPAATSSEASNAIYFNSATETVKAYYPYSEEAGSAQGLTLDASKEELPDLLYAEGSGVMATGRAKLKFNHLLSRITFQITLGEGFEESSAMTSNTEENASTTLPYTLTLAGLKVVGSYQAPNAAITLTDDAAKEISTESSFTSASINATSSCTFMLLPQTVANTITVQCQFTENGPAFATSVPLSQLEAGKNYVFHATISKNKLTITSTGVEQWEESTSNQEFAINAIPVVGASNARRYDYAMDDGSFVMRTATLTEEQKAHCVGIVYWTIYEDDSQGFLTGEVLKKDFPNCCHGLIMSLKNASGLVYWQYRSESVYYNFQNTDQFTDEDKSLYLTFLRDKSDNDNGYTQMQYLEGYAKTKLMKQYNAYCDANSKSDYKVIPISLLEEFEKENPAPLNSTGWYMPTSKEMLLYDTTDRSDFRWDNTYDGPVWEKANTQIQNLGRSDTRIVNSFYWACDEYSSSQAWYIDMYTYNGDYTYSGFRYLGNTGICDKSNGGSTRCVRFICAY